MVLREAQVCVREGLDSQLLSRWNVCYAEMRTIGSLQLFLSLPPTLPPPSQPIISEKFIFREVYNEDFVVLFDPLAIYSFLLCLKSNICFNIM